MSLSFATVIHSFQNADGTPSSGKVEFSLQATITNGNVTLVAGSSVTASLDASGNISQRLASTIDPGTFSQGDALWRCDERVMGAPVRSYSFAVPSGGVTVDLGSLMPFSNAAAWG